MNRFLLSCAFCLGIVVPCGRLVASTAEDSIRLTTPRSDESDITSEHFAGIKSAISEWGAKADSSKGKNISVFIGNTGAGKSTLMNLVCDFPMEVYGGNFQAKKSCREACRVLPGFESCTKFPEHQTSPALGDLYDLPGFNDAGGVVADILNASFIHRILSAASTVRVVALSTAAEIVSGRGEAFKDLAHAMRMFDDDFRSAGCILVINSVERHKMPRMKERLLKDIGDSTRKRSEELKKASDPTHKKELREYIEAFNYFKDLIEKDAFISLPSVCESDDDKSFAEMRDTLVSKIKTLTHTRVKELNMSVSLTPEAAYRIDNFLIASMKHLLPDIKKVMWQKFANEALVESAKQGGKVPASALFKEKRDKLWDIFKDEFGKSKEATLLEPVYGMCYEAVMKKFNVFFCQEHMNEVQILRIKEESDAKEAAEKKRQEAQALADQKEKEVIIEKKRADEGEKAQRIAEENAAEEAKKAAKAQADATLNKEEKEAAQKRADEAALQAKKAQQEAKEDRARLEKVQEEAAKGMAELRKAAAEAEARNEQLKKMHEERLKTIEAEAKERERRNAENIAVMTQELRRVQQEAAAQMASLTQQMQRAQQEADARAERQVKELKEQMENKQAEADEKIERQRRQMERKQEEHAQAMRDMEARKERENRSFEAASRGNGGGGMMIVLGGLGGGYLVPNLIDCRTALGYQQIMSTFE